MNERMGGWVGGWVVDDFLTASCSGGRVVHGGIDGEEGGVVGLAQLGGWVGGWAVGGEERARGLVHAVVVHAPAVVLHLLEEGGYVGGWVKLPAAGSCSSSPSYVAGAGREKLERLDTLLLLSCVWTMLVVYR